VIETRCSLEQAAKEMLTRQLSDEAEIKRVIG